VAIAARAHLLVDLLDGLLLLLVRVQDLKERLVRLWLLGEARLDLGHIVDRLIKLDGGLLLRRCLWWRRAAEVPPESTRTARPNHARPFSKRHWRVVGACERPWRAWDRRHHWLWGWRRVLHRRESLRLRAGHTLRVLELDAWLRFVVREFNLVAGRLHKARARHAGGRERTG
jgi:hypothetical protein